LGECKFGITPKEGKNKKGFGNNDPKFLYPIWLLKIHLESLIKSIKNRISHRARAIENINPIIEIINLNSFNS